MHSHKGKIVLAIVFVIGLLSTGAFAVARSMLPTYQYYGGELSPWEMIERHDQGIPLYCVQRLTEYAILHYQADLFECFDTEEEALQFSQSMRTENDHLEADVQRRISEGVLEQPSMLSSPGH